MSKADITVAFAAVLRKHRAAKAICQLLTQMQVSVSLSHRLSRLKVYNHTHKGQGKEDVSVVVGRNCMLARS